MNSTPRWKRTAFRGDVEAVGIEVGDAEESAEMGRILARKVDAYNALVAALFPPGA